MPAEADYRTCFPGHTQQRVQDTLEEVRSLSMTESAARLASRTASRRRSGGSVASAGSGAAPTVSSADSAAALEAGVDSAGGGGGWLASRFGQRRSAVL